jgi:hypothetical protein
MRDNSKGHGRPVSRTPRLHSKPRRSPVPVRQVNSRRPPKKQAPSPEEPRRRRAVKWIAGLGGVAIAAFITAYATNLGNFAAVLSTEPTPPTGPPVTISLVRTESSLTNDLGDTHVFPEVLHLSPPQLNALNSLNFSTPAYQEWYSSRGGVAADEIPIQVVVRGNRDHAVNIVDMQPVVSCQAPLNGTLFFSPTQGANYSTQLLVNLDEPLAAPSYTEDVGNHPVEGSGYFDHFTVSLVQNEQFTFQITASTARHYCTFSLDLTVLDGSQTMVETINNHGQPFRVTATVAFSRYRELYVGGVAAPQTDRANKSGYNDWLQADPTTYTFP